MHAINLAMLFRKPVHHFDPRDPMAQYQTPLKQEYEVLDLKESEYDKMVDQAIEYNNKELGTYLEKQPEPEPNPEHVKIQQMMKRIQYLELHLREAKDELETLMKDDTLANPRSPDAHFQYLKRQFGSLKVDEK